MADKQKQTGLLVKLTRLFGFLASPMTVGVILTLTMTWLTLKFYASQHDGADAREGSIVNILNQIYLKSIDFRLVNRGEAPGSDRVAILAIDENSIEREGRWPWPREKIGRLIESAVDAGAKVVAFDVVFSEPDPNSSVKTLSLLKQSLAKQKQLSPEANELIDKEMAANNSDQKFADTLGLYQDAVVMGTYFDLESYDVGVSLNPLRDECVDAHYERTNEKRYWEKEEIFPIVEEAKTSDERIPAALLKQVSNYHTLLEVNAAQEWFDSNTSALERIRQNLDDVEIHFPSEIIPTLFVVANIGDEQTLFDLLTSDDSMKRFANRPMILQIFDVVLRSISKHEIVDLRARLLRASNDYCQRFLTPNDELLWKAKFAERFKSAGNDLDAMWAGQSFEPILSELKWPAGSPELEQKLKQWRALSLPLSIPNIARTWVSIRELAANTKHTGYFNAILDTDGTVRRTQLLARRGHNYIPSLALKAFLLDRKASMRFKIGPEAVGRTESKRRVVQSLEILNKEGETTLKVPVDELGRMIINYSGPQQMFPYVSAASILDDKRDIAVSQYLRDEKTGAAGLSTRMIDRKTFLKDKILIVGATAIGVYDLRLTPFEENYPGVETHANALSNLLTESARAAGLPTNKTSPGFMRIHPQEESTMWLIILLGGLAMAAVLTWLESVGGLLATAATLFGIYSIDRYLLFANGYLINVALPLFTVFFLFVTITFYKYFTEERKKQELKGTFAKYVSPAIVDEILRDPENIELGGKKQELTVMFSDVRGFTTISERLDPRALSDLLNSYLTPMTDLVFETKGTLDKYMGDAIMAFWGAPISLPDHAERAATCALKMIRKLKELQADYQKRGLPAIDIGIGLNTGDMSVGNMGSNIVRSYTVMGDSVNLGSRLEGINKEYGTRIIVSEFTMRKIENNFDMREVDWVRVKGKAQPVRIFELLGTKAKGDLQTPEVMLSILPAYNQGFALYHERKFQDAIARFAEVLNVIPDDKVAQLYIERCNDYLEEPPTSDWDGVYTMKTK